MFGNMGNMQGMVKKMQKMQADMTKMQEDVKKREFDATVGGGAVKVVSNGNKELLSVKIDPSAMSADDVEMLEDMIMAAVNETRRKVDEVFEQEMANITGGAKLPGMF